MGKNKFSQSQAVIIGSTEVVDLSDTGVDIKVPLAMNSQKITGAGAATNPGDLVNLSTMTSAIAASAVTAGNGLTETGNALIVHPKDGTITVDGSGVAVGAITDSNHGSRSGGTLHANATTSVAGFMSASDKTKLDGVGGGVQAVSTTAQTVDTTKGSCAVDATSGPLTLNLPSSPTTGDRAFIYDRKNYFFVHNLTLSGNGHNVESFTSPGTYASSQTLDQDGMAILYEYTADSHWKVLALYDVPSSPFTQSGLILWLKNETLGTGTVTTWPDSSPSNIPMTVNSLTVVSNDSTFGNMKSLTTLGNTNELITSAAIAYGAFTIFMIVRGQVAGGGHFENYIYDHGTDYAFRSNEYSINATGGHLIAHTTTPNANDSSVARSLMFTFDGTQAGYKQHINTTNVPLTIDSSADPGVSSRSAVMKPLQQSSGFIAEMLVYNRALTTGEIAAVEAYLNKKFTMY